MLATAELYDPLTHTWSPTGQMAGARYAHTATRLPDGRVLVAGGYDATGIAVKTAEIYDAGLASWTPTGSMTTARGFHAATRLTNEAVLVAGGVNASQPFAQGFPGLSDAEVYDVAAGTWTVTGSMTSARFGFTVTRVSAGKALAAGGEDADISVLQSSETYDLVSGVWSVAADMGSPRTTHTATRLANGKVLVAGGFFIGGGGIDTELYTP